MYTPTVEWLEVFTSGNDADVTHTDDFTSAPLRRVNCGLRLGVSYEYAGLSFGFGYSQMLTNMADSNYWENDRWTVLNNSDVTMSGYSMSINGLEFTLCYTFRYGNMNR